MGLYERMTKDAFLFDPPWSAREGGAKRVSEAPGAEPTSGGQRKLLCNVFGSEQEPLGGGLGTWIRGKKSACPSEGGKITQGQMGVPGRELMKKGNKEGAKANAPLICSRAKKS